LGSRLTGASWGGCTVSLVENENVGKFIEHLKKTFYKEMENVNAIFVSKPSKGVSLINP